jgi:hypothetical protein
VSRDVSQAKTPFVKPLHVGVVIARRPSHYNLKDIVQAIEVDILPGT